MVTEFRERTGASIESDRLEIQVFVNGALHLFQLGPWVLGDCAEGYARGAVMHGRGTSSARVTRVSEREFIVEAPNGSRGRLWDIRVMSKPVDRGLYNIAFRVRLDVLDS